MEHDIWEADENFGMLMKENYPNVLFQSPFID